MHEQPGDGGGVGRMKLLDEIVDYAVDNKQPVSVLLRKCLVLAYQLKNDKLKNWV